MVVLTVIISSIGMVLLAFCHYLENPTSYFKNYEQAKATGIMDRGWIPAYIPKSSYEINETHSIDTNEVNMTFRYKSGDTKEVEKNCTIEKSSKKYTVYKCIYFEHETFIELHSDGSGKLHTPSH